jgi:hypothetical protein
MCKCSGEKKTYFANIQLFTDLVDGLPAGAAPPLLQKTRVAVCSQCGLAQFSVPASSLRYFQAT